MGIARMKGPSQHNCKRVLSKLVYDEIRKEAILGLVARCLSIREIEELLPTIKPTGQPDGIINPKTGRPYSRATIQKDLTDLHAEYKERAMAHIGEHKARQLKEIQELKRAGWQKKDHYLVARMLDAEIKLLGTAAPQKIEGSGPEGGPIPLSHTFGQLTTEQLLEMVKTLEHSRDH